MGWSEGNSALDAKGHKTEGPVRLKVFDFGRVPNAFTVHLAKTTLLEDGAGCVRWGLGLKHNLLADHTLMPPQGNLDWAAHCAAAGHPNASVGQQLINQYTRSVSEQASECNLQGSMLSDTF